VNGRRPKEELEGERKKYKTNKGGKIKKNMQAKKDMRQKRGN
jgi:hypothetical protein